MDEAAALRQLDAWVVKPCRYRPARGAAVCSICRLSGASAAVDAAIARLGGESVPAEVAEALWAGLRDQRDVFFSGDDALWRLSMPSDALAVQLAGAQLVECGAAPSAGCARRCRPGESVPACATWRPCRDVPPR